MDNVQWDKYYTKTATLLVHQICTFNDKKLKSNSTLVDIGCGNGRDSLFFSQRLRQLILINKM